MGKRLLGVFPASHSQHYQQKLMWGMNRHNLSHNSIVTFPSTAMPFGIRTTTHTDLDCITRGCNLLRMQAPTLVHSAGFTAPGLRENHWCTLLQQAELECKPSFHCCFVSPTHHPTQCQAPLLSSFLGIQAQFHSWQVLFYLVQLATKQKLGSKLFSVAYHTAIQAEGKEKSPAFFSRKGQAKWQ